MARRLAFRVLLTSLALLVLGCAVSAAEFGYFGYNDGFYWELDDAGCLTVRGEGRMPGFSNASFQPWYDHRARITSVDVETGSVGNYAFAGLTALTDVWLSPGVESIGNSAFRFCSGLASFTVPEGVTSIGSNAFADCSLLTEITLPDGVAAIGANAFTNTGLIDITLPESLTAVSDGLFYGCKDLERVLLPAGLTEIGQRAFYGCSVLPELTLPSRTAKIGSYAFSHCPALAVIRPLDNVEKLGTGVFDSHTVLYAERDTSGARTLSYMGWDFRPSGAEYSLKYLFWESDTTAVIGMTLTRAETDLRTVTVPWGVTGIADYAFYNCAGLTDVFLPDTLTSVGNYAFYGCGSLHAVTFGGTEDEWRSIAVGENNGPLLAALVIGGGAQERVLDLPDRLTQICSEAFRGLSGVDAIRIPASMVSIAPDAFDPGTLLLVPSGSPWAQWAAENGYECREE